MTKRNKTKKQKRKMAVAKTTTKKRPDEFESIIVNGCLIESNTIYEIVAKEPSSTTPEIYRELGSTKERIPGVSNTISLTQANTGFNPADDIFLKYERIKSDWGAKEKMADEYYRIFAEPLRMYIGDIEKIRTRTEDEFFDKNYDRNGTNFFSVTVGEGRQFNTANPIERFQLYIAIIEGDVAMKGKREPEEKELGLKDEFELYNGSAQYAYVSISNVKSKNEQSAELEMDCAYRFGELLRKEKDLLVGMLQYVGVPAMKTATKAELNSSYKKNIEGKREKIKAFAGVLEKYDKEGETFTRELEILERLKTKKGREAVVKDGSRYFMGEIPVGSNPKSIVATLMKDEDLLKTFYIKTED